MILSFSQNGYVCMAFYRREAHVIEVQMGSQTKRREDACGYSYFDKNGLPYVTLVTTSPETRTCPYMGKFEVVNLVHTKHAEGADPKFTNMPGSIYFDRNKFLVHRSALDLVHGHREIPSRRGRLQQLRYHGVPDRLLVARFDYLIFVPWRMGREWHEFLDHNPIEQSLPWS
ncbi:unnamed protein product [Callosobruchus maculatus]|uniref:DUF7043 domain-containing protein n=1 Tax=Callosobruchus maculatus TaxID=64391 RepID=A0A653D5E6_CALMS|nr:unnamed protein product [Callosobruchus maculatus]